MLQMLWGISSSTGPTVPWLSSMALDISSEHRLEDHPGSAVSQGPEQHAGADVQQGAVVSLVA